MANSSEEEFKQSAKTTVKKFVVFILIFVTIKCIVDFNYFKSYMSSFSIKIFFSLFLFFYLFVNNLVLTKNSIICGTKNQKIAFFSTFFPYIFIYVLGVVTISILPGWVRSFSNTFGLTIAKMCGLSDLIESLFTNQNKEKIQQLKDGETPNIKKNVLIEKVYNDPDTLINELTTNNISYNGKDIIWPDFQEVLEQYIPKSALFSEDSDLEKTKEKMIGYINIKDTIGEYIWLFILSLLTILVSQNHLLSQNCSSTDKDNSNFQDYLNSKLSKT